MFEGSLRVLLLEQVVVQERFLKYPYDSVYHAAIQNRGKAQSWNSEQSGVGWERVTLQSRSLSQDGQTRNSLYPVIPEFESRVDSRYEYPSVVATTILPILLSELDHFLRNNNVFSILHFLGLSFVRLLEELIPHFQFST